LGDILGESLRIDLPQRGGVDKVRVAGNDFPKGRFIALNVGAKQLCVWLLLHLYY
jgi:hypothetical protein